MNTTTTKQNGTTSAAGHTPGPWHVIDLKDGTLAVASAEDSVPAKINGNPDYLPEIRANARLIAAAPELLEAAQNAANVLAAIATGQLKGIERDGPALTMLRLAIARATNATP